MIPVNRVPSSILTEHASFACAASHLAETKSVDGKTVFWSCPVCGYAGTTTEGVRRATAAATGQNPPPPTLPGISPEMLERRPKRRR